MSGKRKRLASWDLYSKRGESIVHLLLPGNVKACKPEIYLPYQDDERDTLAHNLKKRPCPDCFFRYRAIVEREQYELNKKHERLEMFSRIKRGTNE